MGDPEQEPNQAVMSAYLDDQLDDEAARAFEIYLAESPQARAELDDLRKIVRLVGDLPKISAPQGFYEKVRRTLRRRQLLGRERLAVSLISLPFQVLSILVILTIAAIYMMAHLDDRSGGALERDPVPPGQPKLGHAEK